MNKDEKMYLNISNIYTLAKEWLEYVDGIGNQCAYTDRGIEALLHEASQLNKVYNDEADKEDFSYYGANYSMTPQELEAAYRHRDMQYKIGDVLARYDDTVADEDETLSEDDAAVIAERAGNILDKCDPYWEYYWGCFDTAIEEYRDGKCL